MSANVNVTSPSRKKKILLVAANPYRSIPGLYTAERVRTYTNQRLGALPPHVRDRPRFFFLFFERSPCSLHRHRHRHRHP